MLSIEDKWTGDDDYLHGRVYSAVSVLYCAPSSLSSPTLIEGSPSCSAEGEATTVMMLRTEN